MTLCGFPQLYSAKKISRRAFSLHLPKFVAAP
jgi:hypothetical protein